MKEHGSGLITDNRGRKIRQHEGLLNHLEANGWERGRQNSCVFFPYLVMKFYLGEGVTVSHKRRLKEQIRKVLIFASKLLH